MILRPDHPLLRGLRFLAVADNTARVIPAYTKGGPAGTVTLGTGTRTRLHRFGALQGDAAATVVTFGNFSAYSPDSRNITVIGRFKASTSHIGGVVCARNAAVSGWQMLFSNFSASEDGYNFAVFGNNKFLEAQDGFGATAQVGKDVVVAGVYEQALHETRLYTRQPQDPYAVYRTTNTNTNSGSPSTEDWDVRVAQPLLFLKETGAGLYFNGAVAWVAIFDRVLTPSEIADWSRDEEWEFAQDLPVPTRPFRFATIGEVRSGPPLRGAPWASPKIPPVYRSDLAAAVPVVASGTGYVVQPITSGPPVPGAPWSRGTPNYSTTRNPGPSPPSPPPPPPPPPPTPPGQNGLLTGRRKPSVIKDPTAPVRTQEHIRQVSEILNSAMERGELWQPAPNRWSFKGADFVETRPPGAADDSSFGAFPGASWIDSSGQHEYVNISAAVGAAVWKRRT